MKYKCSCYGLTKFFLCVWVSEGRPDGPRVEFHALAVCSSLCYVPTVSEFALVLARGNLVALKEKKVGKTRKLRIALDQGTKCWSLQFLVPLFKLISVVSIVSRRKSHQFSKPESQEQTVPQ